jgi:hypothetical protein
VRQEKSVLAGKPNQDQHLNQLGRKAKLDDAHGDPEA